MTSATLLSAVHLYREGRVTVRPPAAIYDVRSDHGVTYTVVVIDDETCMCSCSARRRCKHIGAALLTHDARVAA